MYRFVIGLAAILAVAVASPAQARDMTAGESAALKRVVAGFLAAVERKDYGAIIKTISPRLVARLAAKVNMTPKAYLAAASKQTKSYFRQVRLESYAVNLSKAVRGQTTDGTPYLLIPSRSVVRSQNRGRVETRFHTLALLDGGKWYLVRVANNRQGDIVREAYPTFRNAVFPDQTVRKLK